MCRSVVTLGNVFHLNSVNYVKKYTTYDLIGYDAPLVQPYSHYEKVKHTLGEHIHLQISTVCTTERLVRSGIGTNLRPLSPT